MLKTDRCQYRCIAGYGFNGSSTSPRYVDEDLSESTGLEETHSGGVPMAGVLEIHQPM
jgi:hypothetical protein